MHHVISLSSRSTGVNRFRKALAKNIKQARGREGFTQQELAERCELSTNYLATIEIGGKFPSSKTLEKLASALKLKPYQFFIEDGDIEAFDRRELIARYRNCANGYMTEVFHRAEEEIIQSV
jgi:transcriptional regulator with XRE-family HTH domain